jgi:predicted small integral membrane protein
MLIRYLKIDLAIFIALFCLFYATQNIFNLEAAYGFVALMLSMDGHVAYPNHFGPAVTSSALTWLALWIIIALEYTAGILAALGAWDMTKSRKASPSDFQAAKKNVIAAVGVTLFIWFGLFSVIGGAYLQMWQTEAGGSVLMNSFWFLASMGIVMLYINMPDAEV